MDCKLAFAIFLLLFLSPSCSRVLVHHGHQMLTCDQTPYPQICNSFINTTLAQAQEAHTFHVRALKITLAQAQEAYKVISSMNFSSFDEQAKMAWEDCLELYEDTVHHLNQTILSSNTLDDVQIYLSASIANHETCKNGFIDHVNLTTHLESFPLILSNFPKLLSNALAITTTLKKSSLSLMEKSGGGRKLLANGFPLWVSVADRRLLVLQNSTQMAKLLAHLVVANDGSGDYKTISEAIVASKKVRSGTKKRFIIYVKQGVYEENVVVTKNMKNLMLIGDGIDATIVTGSKNVQDGSTTFRSATFAVTGEGFIAKGITFENTAGPQKHQAVALRSGSDFSIFYQCSFKGYQDTLYVHSKRQFYKQCDIHGTVDFICGDAIVVIQSCNIYVRKPMINQMNTITAQSRSDPNENTGIVIHDSLIQAGPDLKPVQGLVRTFLGRPWKEYSRTVVMKSFIDGLVDPAGWAPWNGNFAIETLYYREYMNTEVGSGTGGRVRWPGYHVMISPFEARKFTVRNFLGGDSWILATRVPFIAGL